MMRRWVFLLAGLLSLPSTIAAVPPKPADAQAAQQLRDVYAAHRGEFDFLLGSWKFTALYPQSGRRVQGTWDAVSLADGGYILDELRAIDDTGAVTFSATMVRSYDAAQARWEVVTLGEGTGLQQAGTGVLTDGEMIIVQNFDVSTPHPSLLRLHYFGIQQDRFSYSADRSTDGGETWTKDFLKVEVRRVGPPRKMDIVAPPQAASGSNPVTVLIGAGAGEVPGLE
jgi:hypothetical protein